MANRTDSRCRAVFAAAVALLALLAAPVLHAGDWVPPSVVDAEWSPTGAGDFDPTRPSLETFRDWPAESLLEQAYWFPWSWASFQRAILFNRPVFFVLTVNWSRSSHALEEVSLADAALRRAINAGFITVRANADLRPDIRERYQTGAWPMVAFLLPNGLPMLSQATDMGTAQPITMSALDPERMRFFVEEGIEYWIKWPGLLANVAEEWVENEGPAERAAGSVDAAASDGMSRWLLANADRVDGGFGAAPKFIVVGLAEYAALRHARGLPGLRVHSRFTVERLVSSPLYDGREGGIHRLASAPGFTGVQYEKMLEGNATLVRELVHSLRGQDAPALRQALEGTSRFIVRVLGRPEGGFHLAQVADPTSPDGGAYWTLPLESRGEAPPLDPLVLSGANAAASAALLRAGVWLDDPLLKEAGTTTLDRLLEEAYDTGRGVRHAIAPAGARGIYLSTQADVALGLLDGYESTGRRAYLETARQIVDFVRLSFSDPDRVAMRDRLPLPQSVGLLSRPRRPLRPNVRIARAMLRLTLHGLDASYREDASRILSGFSEDLAAFRVHGTEAALAIEELIAEPLLIEISGPPDDSQTAALRRAALASRWPWTLVQTREPAGTKPLATLRWSDKKRRVKSAETMRETIEKLTRIEAVSE